MYEKFSPCCMRQSLPLLLLEDSQWGQNWTSKHVRRGKRINWSHCWNITKEGAIDYSNGFALRLLQYIHSWMYLPIRQCCCYFSEFLDQDRLVRYTAWPVAYTLWCVTCMGGLRGYDLSDVWLAAPVTPICRYASQVMFMGVSVWNISVHIHSLAPLFFK